MASPSRQVQSVNNTELYDRWAKVYDTDGNILQAIDDFLLPKLISEALSLLSSQSPITVTELGCGTGRNTIKLLSPSTLPSGVHIKEIHALDLSAGMLEVAKSRCSALVSTSTPAPQVQFSLFDALQPSSFPAINQIEGKANLVLSTLVLEHLPIDTFFQTTSSFLKPTGGYLILTNMHAEMGRMSRAGFVDPETGEKIRGDSYAHEIEEVVEEGKKWGFEVVGEMGERGVGEQDVGDGKETLLGPRGRKWIGMKVWFGCLMRFDGSR